MAWIFGPKEGNKPIYMYANDKPGAAFVKGIMDHRPARRPASGGAQRTHTELPLPGWLAAENQL
jgi:hypothetical protein